MIEASPVIELVEWDAVIRVRYDVLRPGQPPENASYPYDHEPDTFHVAARDDRGEVVGCATFYPEALDEADLSGGTGWVLRGMATTPEHRGRGLGGEVLEFGVAEVARRGGTFVWCRGRSTAGDFYRRHGFVARGEEFELPVSGPHYVFVRPLRVITPAATGTAP